MAIRALELDVKGSDLVGVPGRLSLEPVVIIKLRAKRCILAVGMWVLYLKLKKMYRSSALVAK